MNVYSSTTKLRFKTRQTKTSLNQALTLTLGVTLLLMATLIYVFVNHKNTGLCATCSNVP